MTVLTCIDCGGVVTPAGLAKRKTDEPSYVCPDCSSDRFRVNEVGGKR